MQNSCKVITVMAREEEKRKTENTEEICGCSEGGPFQVAVH